MSRLQAAILIWVAVVLPICGLIAVIYFLREPFNWMGGVGLFFACVICYVCWDDYEARK